mgnify:CR=1 FL=1
MMIQFAIISLLALLSIPSTASAQSCTANPVAVQILGSGGPGVNRDRASSSYLLWIDAQAKMLCGHRRRRLPSLWPVPKHGLATYR